MKYKLLERLISDPNDSGALEALEEIFSQEHPEVLDDEIEPKFMAWLEREKDNLQHEYANEISKD